MANICKNTINVVGLQEPAEVFIRALSKSMFGLELDDLDPTKWGAAKTVDGKTWYSTLVDEHQREGSYAVRYCILYPKESFQRLGVVVPSFYVETKWKSAVEELLNASKDFPELTFHLAWWILQDGPYGEFIILNGRVVEDFRRQGSWYLFDWDMLFPAVNLLPAHMGLTLAQHGASRVQDAIETIERLRAILDDPRFIDSPFHEYRNGRKLSVIKTTLDDLLARMQEAAKDLSFDGVFLEESEAATIAASRETEEEQ